MLLLSIEDWMAADKNKEFADVGIMEIVSTKEYHVKFGSSPTKWQKFEYSIYMVSTPWVNLSSTWSNRTNHRQLTFYFPKGKYIDLYFYASEVS